VINTLLNKIANVLEKDFLFASFLPALIFVAAVVGTFMGIVGFDAPWFWVASWSTSQKAVAGAAVGVSLIVFAYILNGLRPSIGNLWSGSSGHFLLWLPCRIGTAIQRARFRRLHAKASRLGIWSQKRDKFLNQLQADWQGPTVPKIPEEQKENLKRQIRELTRTQRPDAVDAKLAAIAVFFKTYEGESVSSCYQSLKAKVDGWVNAEQFELQGIAAELDKSFATLESVEATTLGNVMESYNYYSYKRYRIESEVFWPRLQKVVSSEFKNTLADQKTLLDFALTMATLAVVYVALAATVGPWLSYTPGLWVLLGAAGSMVAYVFYALAVSVAKQFGDLVRSAFDLFRLDLIKALGCPRPADIEAERALWKQLSILVVYGEGFNNFPIQPDSGGTHA